MSIITVEAWKCDLCGHVWIKTDVKPKQCAKCRTRIWDCDGGRPVASVREQKPKKVESASPAPVERAQCKACGFTLEPWQGGKACSNSRCHRFHVTGH
jgi:hypothetical protein